MAAKGRKAKKGITGGKIKARISGNQSDIIPAKDKNPDDLEIL